MAFPLLLTRPSRLAGGVPVPPAFSPTDIAGLVAWYDFSDITTLYTDSAKTTPVTADGDPIGAAENKANAGTYDALQTTTSLKPAYKTGIQNGLSSSLYAADQLVTGAITQNQPFTLLSVVRFSNFTLASAYFRTASFDVMTQTAATTGLWLRAPRASTDLDSGFTLIAATDYYLTAVANSTSSANYVNGVAKTTGDAGTTNIDEATIIGDQAAGYIHEHFMCSGVLSAGDLTSLHAYVAAKWAI